MEKSSAPDKESRISNLSNKKKLIEQFVQAKELAKTDPQGMVKECLRLL
jgi:hypothetical protein